jgi:hypothetical protein
MGDRAGRDSIFGERMSAARTLELLRALRTLELMAHHIGTFTSRRDTQPAWRLVLEAIDDRCALLRGVLMLNADADVLRECDLRLARESQAEDGDASTALDAFPSSLNAVKSTLQSRVTIH